MKLYHGSTEIVKEPNLLILNYKTDFGKGFYTTTNMKQAEKWSKIKKERLKKTANTLNIKQYINIYEYTEEKNLKILNFEKATEEWLRFIYHNRKSNKLTHQYDIVKGPVANDNLYQTLVNYENGIYNLKETIERLKTYKLSNQISFHTKESLKCIKYIKTIEIGDNNE